MRDFSPPYGEIEIMSPCVRRITAPNPAPYTFKGTGTYIVGHDHVAVIDPGPNIKSHINAILDALASETITHILITHNHKDHSPAAKPLALATNAKIYAYDVGEQKYSSDDIEEGLDRDFKPDVILNDGEIIEGSNWTMKVIHTPGHLSNHVCYALNEEKALFTGDHIMGWSTTIVSPPDGNMEDYLNSLEKLTTRDDEIYYPTHGWPIDKPQQFVRHLIDHRLSREQHIISAINSGAQNVNQMVRYIYTNITENLHIAASRSVYAHLIRMVNNGHVCCDETPKETSKYYIGVQKRPAL